MVAEVHLSNVSPFWSLRVNFRLSPSIWEDVKTDLYIGERKAVIEPNRPHKGMDDGRTILRIDNFLSENEARQFGHRLRLALLFSAIESMHGIDFGSEDFEVFQPLSGMRGRARAYGRASTHLQAHILEERIAKTWPDVQPLSCQDNAGDGRITEALKMVAAAAVTIEPLSKAVLYIAAVEMLTPASSWTDGQKNIFNRMFRFILKCKAFHILPKEEVEEIEKALKTDIYKSIRPRIVKMMLSCGFTKQDSKQWDEIYKLRSHIFHGSVVSTKQDHENLSERAQILCSKIVLAVAKRGIF